MATPEISVNIVVTPEGAQPTPPSILNTNLINLVTAIQPDYATILPAGLIEDLSSTATYALALLDSAAVETINSVTPFGANPFLLVLLGQIYGVPQGVNQNTSVYVVFSSSTTGAQIPPGFIVTDGTYQYVVQDGGVIETGGSSAPLFCVATVPGSWGVPAGTVTSIVSSQPPGVSLTCTNPSPGTPSAGAQTEEEYAAAVLQAGLVSGQGNASMVKTLLAEVPGVQPRLVACKQVNGGGWEVICGGGDPYAVANAIYNSGLDISTLVGSTIGITAITNASPGVVTTNLDHGLTTGQSNVHIAGVVGMTGVNGGPYTVTVIDETHFSFGVDTTSSGAYVSGGVVTPNPRNISVNLSDYPDSYTVPFVNPPQQTVVVQLTWDTDSPNFVSDTAVAQLGGVAIMDYINSIPVGAPLNLNAMGIVFVDSIASLLSNNVALVSQLTWTISINGVDTSPEMGTFLIFGDPESYFECLSSSAPNVIITQA